MTSPLTQAALDRLASSWSRLDRARPVERADVPRAVTALEDWMVCALVVDEGLAALLGAAYLVARVEEPGGVALPGLRFVAWLVELGHPLDRVVFAATGSPHVFWELFWRPEADLPPHPNEDSAAAQREAYHVYLAGREVRTPAARMTTFLLSMAVGLNSRSLDEAEGG